MCPAMEPMYEIMFYNQWQLLTPFTCGPWLQKWAGLILVPSPMWNPETRVDIKCPAIKPMCQIMFYNQLPASDTTHKRTLAPEVCRFRNSVEPGLWCGHKVSGHETDVSNHVL